MGGINSAAGMPLLALKAMQFKDFSLIDDLRSVMRTEIFDVRLWKGRSFLRSAAKIDGPRMLTKTKYEFGVLFSKSGGGLSELFAKYSDKMWSVTKTAFKCYLSDAAVGSHEQVPRVIQTNFQPNA